MDTVKTSFVELAKQHSAFLVALGSALVAILGIMAALWRGGIGPKERAFAANLLCLILTAFAGAQCMGEVGAFERVEPIWADPAYRIQDRVFGWASIFIYLAGIGFLEVLHTFALHVDPESAEAPRQSLSNLTRVIQGLFLFALLVYSVISVVFTYQHPLLVHTGLASRVLSEILVFVVAGAITSIAAVILRKSRSLVLGAPTSVWITLLATFLAYLYFETTFLTTMEVTDWELTAFLSLVWIPAVASVLPAKSGQT